MVAQERPTRELSVRDMLFRREPLLNQRQAREAHHVAKDLIRTLGPENYFSGLRDSLALQLYASQISPERFQQDHELATNLLHTIDVESQCASPLTALPLPPVGFEIESPAVIYQSESNPRSTIFDEYRQVTTMLGLPSNRDNLDTNNLWEFSPNPTYSSFAAKEMIRALIKTGLVPTLHPALREDIREEFLENVSSKLISLHINLGVPMGLNQGEDSIRKMKNDAQYMAAALALAFTSPLRFKKKESDYLSWFTNTDTRLTYRTEELGERFEMKAFEIRGIESVEQIDVTQLIATTLFGAYSRVDFPNLAAKWEIIKKDIAIILNIGLPVTDDIEEYFNLDNRTVVNLSEDRAISHALRVILKSHAADIQKYLRGKHKILPTA